MKAAFDEIMATAVKRQHEPQRIVGDLLNAEINDRFCGQSWCRSIGATARGARAACPASPLPPQPALLSRASRVERALRALWLYRLAPGGRARRSVLSEASTVRRVSWRVFRAAAADL